MEYGANAEQRLYTIGSERGYSCLGFDVCNRRARALATELGLTYTEHAPGVAALAQYLALSEAARERHNETGFRSTTELTPQLVGLEGRRVEVVDKYGERRRFRVGKSSGWVPCHIELANRRSSGGPAVSGAPFKSIRVAD